jgi:hypothetical protein
LVSKYSDAFFIHFSDLFYTLACFFLRVYFSKLFQVPRKTFSRRLRLCFGEKVTEMETIDQWEAEAKEHLKAWAIFPEGKIPGDLKRITALIELIRTKDYYLEKINHQAHAHEGDLNYKWLQNESAKALMLTEDLK